jgi:two-component system response regulator ResD
MKTVIVADDDPIFRNLMSHYLSRKDFNVVEDVSGKNVRKHILEYKPIACFIDIVMAEKEGLETIAELRDLPVKPILIAVSSDSQYLEWATDLGANFVLLKPITTQKIDEILALIDL